MKKKFIITGISSLFLFTLILISCSSAENEISKEAVHKIDDLLNRRVIVVVKAIKEDKLLANQDQYNRVYQSEIERSVVLLNYFNKRQEIISTAIKEIEEGYKELDLLFSKYNKGEPGFDLINSFRNYFYHYKQFFDAASQDLDNKVKAIILYKTIVSLETNQQSFFNALELNKINQVELLLNNEAKLIDEYKQTIYQVDFDAEIPDEWKKEFVDTYIQMHEWNKKFYEAKKQNDDVLYSQLRKEGANLLWDIPYNKTSKFNNELEKILFETPIEIDDLEVESREAGMKAYELYYIHKKKIGENPYEFKKKLNEIK